MEGRWTLAPLDYDTSRALRVTATNPDNLYGEAVPAVPCDDAAIERAARKIAGDHGLRPGRARLIAVDALRAAGETP